MPLGTPVSQPEFPDFSPSSWKKRSPFGLLKSKRLCGQADAYHFREVAGTGTQNGIVEVVAGVVQRRRPRLATRPIADEYEVARDLLDEGTKVL